MLPTADSQYCYIKNAVTLLTTFFYKFAERTLFISKLRYCLINIILLT